MARAQKELGEKSNSGTSTEIKSNTMFFDSFAEFIAMGKHGFYVWFCYGVTALVIIANILAPIRQRKKLIEQQARLQRREKENASAA